MSWDDPRIVAAIIAAGVSIVTVFLSFVLKSLFELHFHVFKLEAEYEYGQRKKIKEAIAKYKIQLLDAADSLSHRLWNFITNCDRHWHTSNDLQHLKDHYYLASFTYRMLAFFAWIRKMEKEMVYLDSTVASRQDLNFVKFLKLLAEVLCDVALFDGLEYDDEYATDHFFKNDLLHMSESFCTQDGVVTFSDFKDNVHGTLDTGRRMAAFISGMHPGEDRLRWDRLQALHLVLMMLLNIYGYDFQYTAPVSIAEAAMQPRPNRTIRNIEKLLVRFRLGNDKDVKRAFAVIKNADKLQPFQPTI